MNRQRGVSLSGLLIGLVIVIAVALLGMKVAPSAIEYFKILKAVKAVAQDAATKSGSINDIRVAYTRHVQVGDMTKVAPTDLEITKDDAGQVVISFAYEDKIPLFANVSLAIDYEGSSAK
jgi:hypothetical protein